MHLEILTPDEEVFKGEVDYVSCPGIDGYFGVLNNHAPLISSLKAGNLKITPSSGQEHFDASEGKMKHTLADDNKSIIYAINGGAIEVKNNKIIILAE